MFYILKLGGDSRLKHYCTMANYLRRDAASALSLLAEAALQREQNLAEHNGDQRDESSDDEADSVCPYFDAFYAEGGVQGIKDMINFTPVEFEEIWLHIARFVTTNYNCGRGKRSKVKGKDMVFMLLVVLKHGGRWDILGQVFRIKGPCFERMITNFAKLIAPELYKIFVTDLSNEFTMAKLRALDLKFEDFPEAYYAVDVTFQQSYRPSGSMQEGKLFFSGKHKLYGIKVEVSVLPNGIALGCTNHYPGSVSDFEIIQRNREWHRSKSRKSGDEHTFADNGMLIDRFPNLWAVLADKGYQGLAEFLRAILPIKKPRMGTLSLANEAFNRKVSSARIIVENYFGRLCSLWSLLSSKWRWSHSLYDEFFTIALALTNVHIKNKPLRHEDGEKFTRVRNRLSCIANEIAEKRKVALERYQSRRRAELNHRFRRDQHPGSTQ